jgi:hypothetical protein
VNGPLFHTGFWSTTTEANNLTADRIQQQLRFEQSALANARRILSWHEGRVAGLEFELTRRREAQPLGRHAQKRLLGPRGQAS